MEQKVTGSTLRSEATSLEKDWKTDRPKIYQNIPKDLGFQLIMREIMLVI